MTATPTRPLRLHSYALSGHAHRARLFLSLLGLPHEVIEVDLLRGQHKTPEFLAKNPFGQVPVLEDGDIVLPDSLAILTYLAGRHDPEQRWLPADPVAAARVQRWFSASAGPLVQGPGLARVEVLFGRPRDPRRPDIAASLFAVMEAELSRSPFLAGPSPTLADLAMYTYTAHAPEGGISLEPYPALRRWIAEIEALPGFVAMPRAPVRDPAAA